MKYNKEYIEQLLRRFIDGETTEQEEQFLAEYFSTSDSIPEEWETYREMFASFSTDAYDFTEEELIGAKRPTPTLPVREGDLIPQKHRIIKMWPWLAAACVAALMVVVLAPPQSSSVGRELATNVSEQTASTTSISVTDKSTDEVKSEPITTTDKQIAQATEHKASSAQEQSQVSSVPKKKAATALQKTTRQEPAASVSTDLAMAEEPKESHATGTSNVSEDWDEAIEQDFRINTAPIRMRGQQVMQRVAMMQAAHRNQIQYVEL